MVSQWIFNLTISKENAEQPLRGLLSSSWRLPRHLIGSLRRNNRVLVNGKYLPMNFLVHEDDQVNLTFLPTDFSKPFPNVISDSSFTPEILYEDNNLVVVNKRQGDKTHPNQPGEKGATINFLAAYLKTKSTLPYMVHRLDQMTSGAMIFAKNPAVVPILVNNLQTKRIYRIYLAWVHGDDFPSSGIINEPIGRDPEDKRKRMVNGLNALRAITNYKVVKRIAGFSLVKIKLDTGRTHQIRVHFSFKGRPLVGDPLYSNDLRIQPMLLHSWQIRFPLPFSQETKEVTATLPKRFTDFERKINR